jgi:cation:H+ antiporter
MLLDVVSILFGLVGLFVGGEWLIRSASRLATGLGIPALVVGVTVVAIGTSMPELVVSLSAALSGISDLAIGSVVGSNIANIGLILGLAGLMMPLNINTSLIRREIPFMIVVSVTIFLMAADGSISRLEGLLLIISYAIFAVVLYRTGLREARREPSTEIPEEVAAIKGSPRRIDRLRELASVAGSLIVLIVGAQFTVNGAVSVARVAGINEVVIGLTLVAVGTSLPEIATAVIATLRGHSDLAAGNAIGSNIANILVILGITALIHPIAVPASLLNFEFPAMVFFALAIIPLVLNRVLARWQAALLLAAYIAFILVTFR